VSRWLPNAICFQLVWLAAVGGAAQGWWWAGPAAVAAFAAWQLPLSRWPRADALLMLGTAALGFLIDTLWVQLALMRFTTPLPWAGLAPVWIVALWMGFALTLNHSLAGLKPHLWWAALLGVVGGPLAYGVAERAWSAVALAQPAWQPLAALALAWGLVTPLLLLAARRLVVAPEVAPAPAR
jgi:hypothetical protein